MRNKLIFLFLFWVVIVTAQNNNRANYFQLRKLAENNLKLEDSLKHLNKDKDTIKEPDNDSWGRFNNCTWFWDSRAGRNGTSDAYSKTMYNYINNCNNALKVKTRNVNNGATQNWTALGPFTNSTGNEWVQDLGQTKCVWASSGSNIVYVGAASGGLWKSTSGGGNWVCLTDQLPTFGVKDIAVNPDDADNIYIATGKYIGNGSTFTGMNFGYGVFFTTNGGQNWNTNSMQSLPARERAIFKVLIDPDNTQIIYALSYSTVYKSTNGGYNWVDKNAPALPMNQDRSDYCDYDNMIMNPGNTNIIIISSRGKGYQSDGGYIYRSTDAGNNWSANLAENIADLSDKFQDGLAIGFRPDYPYDFIVSLLLPSPGRIDIELSTDNGNSFTNIASNGSIYDYNAGFNLIMSITSDNIYFGVIGLAKYNFTNNNFPSISGWHADIRGFATYTTGGNDVVYVANDGGIMKSTNNGSSWQDINQGMNIGECYSVGISEESSPPYTIAIGRNDNGTDKSTDGGNNWSYVCGGDGGTTYIDPTDHDNIYYTLIGGLNYRYFTHNCGSGIVTGFINTPLVENPVTKWVYIAANEGPYGNYYKPVIKKSTNHGANWSNAIPEEEKWQVINNETVQVDGISAVGYSISDPNVIYYALQFHYFPTGAPWYTYFQLKKSTDGGATVSNITANFDQSVLYVGRVTGIVTHPSDPNHVWVCLESIMDDETVKKVYQSTDGGSSWQDYSNGLSDIPCLNMIFDEANQRLLLGTDVGVYYRHLTDDSWHLMNNSQFPQAMAADMKINRKTGDLYVATHGRGIYKTNLPGYCYSGSPVTISSNTTWTTTQTICDDINITAGTLTIQAAQTMPTQATITIESGATLAIDGNTVTNANIVVESGGKLTLINNGVLEINTDDNITIDAGGLSDLTYGEIKKMNP
ncbi:MAG: hypothetical protein WC223_09800 [Bacteroidales bacterium]|jgi:photosystem II stability/assembly factor-like uncharacterized protein